MEVKLHWPQYRALPRHVAENGDIRSVITALRHRAREVIQPAHSIGVQVAFHLGPLPGTLEPEIRQVLYAPDFRVDVIALIFIMPIELPVVECDSPARFQPRPELIACVPRRYCRDSHGAYSTADVP